MRNGRRVLIALAILATSCGRREAPSGEKVAAPTAAGPRAAVRPAAAAPDADAPAPSLVSFSSGAIVVQKPAEYGETWSAFWLLDERRDTGWATPKGVVTPQRIVIALPEETELSSVAFDTGGIDGEGRGAKDVLVEISASGPGAGFEKIAQVSLEDRKDGQAFPVTASVPGRWVRITVQNNHGSAEYTELMEFRAFGAQRTHTPFPDVSGTYDTNYGRFHLRQQGTSVTGCYEHSDGTLVGGIEGRIMKFTWSQSNPSSGPAIMVFSPDRKLLFGLWWYADQTTGAGGQWNGTRIADEVGTCPHWAGGAAEQMAKDLQDSGRTRIYGINFDSDSDRIRDESKPTLEKIAAMLREKPDWKLAIEGHTDSTATAEHNQNLSDRRARAVLASLTAAGIDASRLSATGYGATRPVAGNESATGRAQNRRVELALALAGK